jgi:hypothetical protein
MDWRAVALAVLVACAGCTALTGADDPAPARETGTVTPAAVPDPADRTYAPGVTGSGVVSPSALVDAHDRSLANRSYTVVIERTRTSKEFQYRHTVTAAVDGTASRIRVSDSSTTTVDNRTTVLIGTANGTVAFERTNGGPFRRSERTDAEVPTGGEVLGQAFRAVRVDTAPQRIGTDSYRLTGDTYRNLTAMTIPGDRLMGVALDAEIGSSGRFRSLNWRFTVERGRTNVSVVTKMDVRRVGRTTVNTTPPTVGKGSVGEGERP